jgi:hypothetical protein
MFKKAHGIEVLLRKASVDPEFRELLLAERAAAAGEIDLDLTPAEESILATVPEADLVRMIEKIEVPEAHRAVFLGKTAAVMLAIVVGTGLVATCGSYATTGIRPKDEAGEDRPKAVDPVDEVDPLTLPITGIRPDPVEPKEKPGGDDD